MKMIMVQALFWVVFFAAAGCKKEGQEIPFTGFENPANFPKPVYDIQSFPVTENGFFLGRKLFYESMLSRDNTISCGSCHIQSAAFTHHGHDLSHGIEDRLGSRNAPAIQNMAWYTSFMWDGGVHNLDLQPIAPIENPVEMDENLYNVIEKLRKSKTYPGLFKKAFGTEEISSARMLQAMSQFMVMLKSADSKYDKVMRKEGASFSADETAGLMIFKEKCATCHAEPLFTDQTFRDNGIGKGPNNDLGRYDISLRPEDKYKFKVPSLRNVMVTAPYMHDGRFRTIDAVLAHYQSEIKATPNVDTLLVKADGTRVLQLSNTEVVQLKAFLHTLTDDSFIRNPRFSEQ